MEMKILFFVILVTIGGAFGAFDKEKCMADYKSLLASWTDKSVAQSFIDNEFPLIDLTTGDGLKKGRCVATAILECAKCNVDATTLTASEVAEVFNSAFDSNARTEYKTGLKDWLNENKDFIKDMDKTIRKSSYILMSPKKTEKTTLSAIEDKCSILDERLKGDFSYEKEENRNPLRKMEKIVACGGAPMSAIKRESICGATGPPVSPQKRLMAAPGSPIA